MAGMCPWCGDDFAVERGLIVEHIYNGAACPGKGNYPRNAEADARPLWNGEPNKRSEGYKSWAAQQADIINNTGA